MNERTVLDTNVLISGLFSSTSKPALALEAAVLHGRLLASRATMDELVGAFMKPKFDRVLPAEDRVALLERLALTVEIAEIVAPVRACRDPRDDKFLEVAVNGAADVIVTGDADLLALHPFRGIAILTPAAYLARQRSDG